MPGAQIYVTVWLLVQTLKAAIPVIAHQGIQILEQGSLENVRVSFLCICVEDL